MTTLIPKFQRTGTGAVNRAINLKLAESISVLDFGAVGDGVTDDTSAIQAAINSLPNYPEHSGELVFPDMGAFYRITDTLHFGIFSVSPNNNVNGFAFTKYDLTVTLNQKIKWDGADQPSSTIVIKTDTVGTYPLITDDKPMISVVACRGFKITGTLDASSIDTLKHAYAGIWFQGNHNVHSFDKFTVLGSPRIGVRHGCAWDLVTNTQYWGYADSPYYKANVYNAPAVGGWQGDTQSFTACSISGTLAHYTTESGQNLSISMNAVNMGEGATSATYGILMVGGRFTGNGISVNQASTYDVWMPTGTNSFTATDYHSESAAAVKIRTTTNAVSPNITITNSDAVAITLAGGGGNVMINNCVGVTIVRNDINAIANISVNGGSITNLAVANTGVQANVNIKLQNCALNATLLNGATASNCFITADNCANSYYLPVQAGSFSTAKENFNGQTHTVKNKVTLAFNTVTLLGAIETSSAGTGCTGTAKIRINYATSRATTMASVYGEYAIAFVVTSTPIVAVSAVTVLNETKGFAGGFAAFTAAVTAVVSGTTIQIFASTPSNSYSVGCVCEMQGEVYLGGYSTTSQAVIWIPA